MKEHQLIEWKEGWRDEYLKWISGFANPEGGVLVMRRNGKGDLPACSLIEYPQAKLWGHMPRSANSMHTLSNLVAMD